MSGGKDTSYEHRPPPPWEKDGTIVPTSTMRIGKFEIDGELGHGAMGVVYGARDPSIGRRVAIKTLRLADPTGPDAADLRERFKREARAAGVLQHPAIVTIHDVGESEGNPYIAMEYLDGANLADILRASGAMERSQAVSILAQIAEGLDYAHDHGIVHRDVKPANVVLTSGGVVKITDFGIAKLESAEQLTRAGHFVGTPNYTAPEQLAGKPVDGRADTYSLAVMAYELLSGTRPFVAESFSTLTYKIMNSPPPAVPELPPRVMAVLAKGMAKKPEDRYPSAVAMIRALGEALDEPLPSRTPSGRIAVSAAPHTVSPPTVPSATVPSTPTPRLATPFAPTPSRRRTTMPLIVVGLGLFGGVLLVVAAFIVWTLLAGPATGVHQLPATPGPSPTATRPSRPSPSTPFDPNAPDNPHVLLNVSVTQAALGPAHATLLVDGTPFKTFDFTCRPSGRGTFGYVKKVVDVPAGSHRVQIRVEAPGKVKATSPPLERTFGKREQIELKADLDAKTGKLSATLGAPARP